MNTLVLLYLLVGLIAALIMAVIEVKERFYLGEEIEITLMDLCIFLLIILLWPAFLVVSLCLEIFGDKTLFRIKRRSKQ